MPGNQELRDTPIRVAIIDAREMFGQGIEALIQAIPDLECVGRWKAEPEALNGLRDADPNVVLIDADQPHAAKGFAEARARLCPHARLILLVDCWSGCSDEGRDCRSCHLRPVHGLPANPGNDDEWLHFALRRGYQAVVCKRHSFRSLEEAIRAVMAISPLEDRGGHSFPADHRLESVGAAGLSAREREVAGLISAGFSNKQISARLRISYQTVKNHVSSILEKLALEHRTQIAVYALSLRESDSVNRD